ncbi:hypothetical protein ACL02S_10950 [Nocardia sp. 004]|uniref:hypothetical protein n=1 Tax=Nocardia sp. 004 TaxID=3385978 RepID=UPI0039A24DA7
MLRTQSRQPLRDHHAKSGQPIVRKPPITRRRVRVLAGTSTWTADAHQEITGRPCDTPGPVDIRYGLADLRESARYAAPADDRHAVVPRRPSTRTLS